MTLLPTHQPNGKCPKEDAPSLKSQEVGDTWPSPNMRLAWEISFGVTNGKGQTNAMHGKCAKLWNR